MQEVGHAKANKTTIAIGLLTVGLGAVPLLMAMGILPASSPSYDAAPNWIGLLIGLMFMGAGLLVITQALAGGDANGRLPVTTPRVLRDAYNALGLAITLSLGVVLTWVAFGPGPRHFSTSIGVPGLSLSGRMGGDWLGRAAFGFCAILFWAFFAIWLVTVIRRRRQSNRGGGPG